MVPRLEQYFGFEAHNTSWRTEIFSGLTTFVTMSYIIFVNPVILAQTGMPLAAVTASTCLCAAFCSPSAAFVNACLVLSPTNCIRRLQQVLACSLHLSVYGDLSDQIGTLVAVADCAGLSAPDHTIPRLRRIFFADGTSTIVGSLAGTSTATSYIESAAGIATGGRTGVTAIVTRLRFIPAIFVAPASGAIPDFATAPALILVGAMMLSGIGAIDWDDPRTAIPAFLTIITIPLTYSVAAGLSFCLISYAAVKFAVGGLRRSHCMLYLLSILFLIRFIFLMQP